MDGDPRVRQLLEELLDSEQTPEEVCHHCPELLPEVHRRWQRKRACDAQLDALFLRRSPTRPSAAHRRRRPRPNCPGSRVMKSWRWWAAAAWASSTGPGTCASTARSPSRCCSPVRMPVGSLENASCGKQEGAGLRHPNIVQVHDMGDQDGLPYFTMEFVEGGNLAQKLAGMPQPPRQAAALLATLAEAVQAAHRCGIVHRDLKPANVLLTADGTPKICDLGLARRLDGEAGLTWTGTAVGTPSYMAPEQAEAGPQTLGPAVDIHALGAILYELLTGRPPFRAATAAETVRQVISQDPVPPSRLNGKVPRDLETICLKCLHREPHLRYAGAAALAADLHRFLGGEAIAARPEGRLAAGPAGPSAARAIDVGRGRHALDGRPARGRSVADLRSGRPRGRSRRSRPPRSGPPTPTCGKWSSGCGRRPGPRRGTPWNGRRPGWASVGRTTFGAAWIEAPATWSWRTAWTPFA